MHGESMCSCYARSNRHDCSSLCSNTEAGCPTPMLHCRSAQALSVSPVQCAAYAPDPTKVDLRRHVYFCMHDKHLMPGKWAHSHIILVGIFLVLSKYKGAMQAEHMRHRRHAEHGTLGSMDSMLGPWHIHAAEYRARTGLE